MQLQTLKVAHLLIFCYASVLIESYAQMLEFHSNSDPSAAEVNGLPQPQIVDIPENVKENVTPSGRQLLQNILNFLFPDIFTTTLPPDEEETTTTTTAVAEETTTTTTTTTTAAPAVVTNNNTVVNYYVPVPAPPAYSYPYYGYPYYYGYGAGYGYTNYGYYG